jgi:hypothetical protein
LCSSSATPGERSGNTQGTFGEPAGNIQLAVRRVAIQRGELRPQGHCCGPPMRLPRGDTLRVQF